MITGLNEYQDKTQATAIYPGQGSLEGLNYSIMGMIGEAGEVANRFKKVLRDDEGKITPEAKMDLISEVGDTFWYLARILKELDVTLEEACTMNVAKLEARAMRNKILGAGNNR